MELTEQWQANDKLLGCSDTIIAKEGQTIEILAPDNETLFKAEVAKGKTWHVTIVVQVEERNTE